MSNGSRVFCKSFLVPSLASTELIRFKFFRAQTSSSNLSRVFQMATEPPSSSSNGDSSSVPASSAIDFLSLCHRLKMRRCGDCSGRVSSIARREPLGKRRLGLPKNKKTVPFLGAARKVCIKMAIVHDIAEANEKDFTMVLVVPGKAISYDLNSKTLKELRDCLPEDIENWEASCSKGSMNRGNER
ncbi:unnamed protein product [Camellia sinensis]